MRRGRAVRPTGVAWRRLRLSILARDGWVCQIRGARCVGGATTVDHRVPLRLGGAPWSPDNLRAACAPCNFGREGGTRRPKSGVASRDWNAF